MFRSVVLLDLFSGSSSFKLWFADEDAVLQAGLKQVNAGRL